MQATARPLWVSTGCPIVEPVPRGMVPAGRLRPVREGPLYFLSNPKGFEADRTCPCGRPHPYGIS